MSQQAQILAHLKRSALDPLTALHRYGCFRLGARIYELKCKGFAIASEIVERGGKRIARYRLVK
jgi:hypothetical protein